MVAIDFFVCLLGAFLVDCVPALVSDEKRPPPVDVVSWAEAASELAAIMATCENFMLMVLRRFQLLWLVG
jgi:hypothetical protein